jgi:hypothetical protein
MDRRLTMREVAQAVIDGTNAPKSETSAEQGE